MAKKKKHTAEQLPLPAPVPEGTGALTPERFTGLKKKKPKQVSAGVPAVQIALGQVRKYMAPGDAAKVMFRLNQKGGIDCPGCAWPDPDDDRSKLGEYCENGIKAIAEEAQKKMIGRGFFAQHSVAELGQWLDFELGKAGRLAEPLVLEAGATHYQPISWEDAFQLIAEELRQLASPDEAVFYTSGRTSNEAAFLYQLFVREFGTNNLPDCSNMCHEASGKAMTATLGTGKGTVTLADFYESDLIVILGQNPGTNHPRMLSALERCKENGGKIIAINPLKEAGLLRFSNPQRPAKLLGKGTALADLFLQVRINGDIPLLKAIMSLMLHDERTKPGSAFDMEFITQHTEGYETFVTDLLKYDFNTLAEASGVPRKDIKEAVEMIKKADKMIVCWAMGLTQHANGVDNIREIVNLLLLKGAIGKPGSGACPVRGHSNVQGDRTMGIWESPKPEFLDKLQEAFGFNPPRKHGYSTADAIQAMHKEKAKVFLSMGGNFLSASPDTEFTAEALRKCRLTVHVSTKLNRSHLIHGQRALILPCLGRTDRDVQSSGEQLVSTENSSAVVQMSKGVLPPISSHLRSEPAIVAGLAKAVLGNRSKVDWDAMTSNYDQIRDAIEKVVPGFEAYNKRVREPGGFYLPNPPRNRVFPTASGKAHFSIAPVPENLVAPGQYVLMSIRSHDQFNTTVYGLDDRYRGIYNERRVVLLHPEDMRRDGIAEGQKVHLISEYQGVRRTATHFLALAYDIPSGCAAAYFPEVNVLLPVEAHDPESKTPASKFIIIRIEKAG
ncbi:MAG: FdhF/YdeP family oxidoreductase [Haliscomenobacter sp.]|nr:FdhF/YdeP family oxidoreductase [Haliscomenobacter sp.]